MRLSSKPGTKKARKLRRAMSLPEVILWRLLRTRPADLKFRRQHPAGPYTLDFYCESASLAIEVDGETHDRGDQPTHDAERDRWLRQQGISTLRIAARDVLGNIDGVMQLIERSADPLHRAAHGPPPLQGGFS